MSKQKLKRLHSHKPRIRRPLHRLPHHIMLDKFLAIELAHRPDFVGSEFDLKLFSNPDMDAVQVIENNLPALPHTGATKIKSLFATLLDFEGLLVDVQNQLENMAYTVRYPKPIHYLAIDLYGKTLADVRATVGASLSKTAA